MLLLLNLIVMALALTNQASVSSLENRGRSGGFRRTTFIRRYGGYGRYGVRIYGGGFYGGPIAEIISGVVFFIIVVIVACCCRHDEEEVVVIETYEDKPIHQAGNGVAYPDGYRPGDAPPSAPPGYVA